MTLVTIRNHNLILDSKFTNSLHPKIQYELGKICPENQIKFKELYSLSKRSLAIAYVCLIFFPSTHYAFLGRWQLQVLFWLTLGGGSFWWMADIVRLPAFVKQTNYYYQQKILRELNAVNVFKTSPPLRVPTLVSARVA